MTGHLLQVPHPNTKTLQHQNETTHCIPASSIHNHEKNRKRRVKKGCTTRNCRWRHERMDCCSRLVGLEDDGLTMRHFIDPITSGFCMPVRTALCPTETQEEHGNLRQRPHSGSTLPLGRSSLSARQRAHSAGTEETVTGTLTAGNRSRNISTSSYRHRQTCRPQEQSVPSGRSTNLPGCPGVHPSASLQVPSVQSPASPTVSTIGRRMSVHRVKSCNFAGISGLLLLLLSQQHHACLKSVTSL